MTLRHYSAKVKCCWKIITPFSIPHPSNAVSVEAPTRTQCHLFWRANLELRRFTDHDLVHRPRRMTALKTCCETFQKSNSKLEPSEHIHTHTHEYDDGRNMIINFTKGTSQGESASRRQHSVIYCSVYNTTPLSTMISARFCRQPGSANSSIAFLAYFNASLDLQPQVVLPRPKSRASNTLSHYHTVSMHYKHHAPPEEITPTRAPVRTGKNLKSLGYRNLKNRIFSRLNPIASIAYS